MPRLQSASAASSSTSSRTSPHDSPHSSPDRSPDRPGYSNVLLEDILGEENSEDENDLAIFGGNFQNSADREERFGKVLNGISPENEPKKRNQMEDAKRKLTYKMQNATEVASSWWGKMRTQLMAKEDIEAESKLLHMLDQLTIDYMIGPKIDRSFRRGLSGSFGFQIGSSRNLRGSRVSSVYPNGPAGDAGLDVGDIIMEIGGKNVFGENHDNIVAMIEKLDALDMRVARLLDVDVPANAVPLVDVADRPKPPSYMKIRNTLISKCGEETYTRCKRRVQVRMERLSDRYDAMSGHAKESNGIFSKEILDNIDNGWVKTKDVASDTLTGLKRWVTSKIVTDDTLEIDDANRLAATRVASSDAILVEALTLIIKAQYPLAECPECFVKTTQDASGGGGAPQLSYSGVRSYLIKHTSETCFNRNRGMVQQKLQEREIEKLQFFSKPKVVSDIAIGYESNEVHLSL